MQTHAHQPILTQYSSQLHKKVKRCRIGITILSPTFILSNAIESCLCTHGHNLGPIGKHMHIHNQHNQFSIVPERFISWGSYSMAEMKSKVCQIDTCNKPKPNKQAPMGTPYKAGGPGGQTYVFTPSMPD